MAMQQFVIPLSGGEAIDPDRVGPKAANLAALAACGVADAERFLPHRQRLSVADRGIGIGRCGAPAGLGRRRRPCGQLNDFVRGFNAVIHGYSDYRVAFLNDHSSRFGSFSRRV
jgi:hypothetical protein